MTIDLRFWSLVVHVETSKLGVRAGHRRVVGERREVIIVARKPSAFRLISFLRFSCISFIGNSKFLSKV